MMLTNKQSISGFHDGKEPDVINRILDLAQIRQGVRVLDVACGTGVLFPYFLERKVKEITGVDLSPGMIAQAEKKFSQPNIHLIRADIQACRFDRPFDRCVMYEALGCFPEPARLLRRLADFVKPGGRLTVAWSSCKEDTSRPQPLPREMAELIAPWFVVDVCQNDGIHVISGVRNDTPVAPTVPRADKR
ncbi:MAG: class I SAM-dependent methyltransferase [Faecousia sp.]